jgi:hypothetical protein
MLDEARQNCQSLGLENVRFVRSDDELSQLSEKFDLINSFIVFQHIKPSRGIPIVHRLLEHLLEGGVCMLHLTYAKEFRLRSIAPLVRRYVPLAKNAINVLRGRSFFYPEMQMHTYDMNAVLQLLQKSGMQHVHSEFTNHGGNLGVLMCLQKSKSAS